MKTSEPIGFLRLFCFKPTFSLANTIKCGIIVLILQKVGIIHV